MMVNAMPNITLSAPSIRTLRRPLYLKHNAQGEYAGNNLQTPVLTHRHNNCSTSSDRRSILNPKIRHPAPRHQLFTFTELMYRKRLYAAPTQPEHRQTCIARSCVGGFAGETFVKMLGIDVKILAPEADRKSVVP